MSYHILHLLSPDLRVRIDQNRVEIVNRRDGTLTHVPLDDIAIAISAAPSLVLTGAALREFGGRRIPLLVCDEKYQPVSLTLPYYSATDTGLLRAQVRVGEKFKFQVWKRIVAAKVRNQAAALAEDEFVSKSLNRLLKDMDEKGPDLVESMAARTYWGRFFRLVDGDEAGRKPRTRVGANGMLDYGYAVVRTAVLRSLAGRGLIAALGVHHTDKAGHHALADDLVEPVRPWVDRALLEHLRMADESDDFRTWIPRAAGVLTLPVRIGRGGKTRLLYAIDRYVESYGRAILEGKAELLWTPSL